MTSPKELNTERALPDNPWRESLENCIDGSNYLRASEYRRLINELDRLYALSERAAEQPAERAGLNEQDAWSCSSEADADKVLRGIGTPFAIAIAQRLAYFEAQDGLLSQAQDDVNRLRLELAEVERPLSEQMARLNRSVIEANARASEAELKL